MSKQVDERVVSMQFDNRQFERNVSTTMSTLDKLKRSLNLSGSAKGLDDINNAARNVNMSGLSGAIEQVSAKFSALQVIGITALANITNSAVEAGKKFVKALTIQPITTGFNEYELKMNSVQTIMASTGESIDTVNSYLEELNRYSDQTIYSFQDMTQNIGKFTNAGVKLEDAVAAIKGISNEAAISGANANEASRAMYNFAQALSAGYVKLIDWKSIENANMATVEFKNQLIETAVSLGTVTKSADGLYETLDGNVFNATQNFNEVLNDQWMTSEVLVETLKKYADETTEIGAKASKAATEVKTFSQLFDTLKESAQSGWAKTWEIIIGDLVEAKGFLTMLSEFMGGVIDKMSDLRNNFLGGIFNSKWDKLNDKIEAAGLSTETFVEKLKEASKENGKSLDELIEKHGSLSKAIEEGAVSTETIRKAIKKLIGVQDDATKSTEEMGKIVDEVLDGKWGDGEKRWEALTEAGYNWMKVQDAVNDRLGSSVKRIKKIADAQGDQLESLVLLSEEQLRNKGYTDEQIKAIKELEAAANGSKTSIDGLIDSLTTPSGRTLLFKTVENFLVTIKGLLGIVKQSWDDAFGDPDRADKIYGFIEVIYEFSESLKELASSEGTVTTVKKIVDGIMAALDVSWYMFSGSLVATIKLATAVLGLFGTDLVEVASYIAGLVIKFRDWVKENTMFINMGNKLAVIIVTILKGFKRLFDVFTSLNIVTSAATKIWDKLKEIFGKFSLDFKGLGLEGAVATIESLFDIIEKWIKKLDGSEAARNFVDGLVNGLLSGVDYIVDLVIKIGQSVLDAIDRVWDINSPSVEGYTRGKYLILGVINGALAAAGELVDTIFRIFSGAIESIKNFDKSAFVETGRAMLDGLFGGIETLVPGLYSLVKTIQSKFVDMLSDIDLGTIIAFVLGRQVVKGFTGISDVLAGLTKVIDKFTAPIEGLGKILDNAAGVLGEFKNIVGNVANALKGLSFNFKARAIKEISIAVILLAGALLVLSYIPEPALKKGMAALFVMLAMLGVLIVLINKVGSISTNLGNAVAGMANIAKAAGLIMAVAVSMLLIAAVAKIVGGIEPADLGKASVLMTNFGLLIAGLIWSTKLAGSGIDHASKIIGKTSVALLLLALVAKIAGTLDSDDMGKTLVFLTMFELFIVAYMGITRLAGTGIDQAGKTITKIAAAMILLTLVAKLAGTLNEEDFGKATVALLGLSAVIAILVATTRLAGTNSELDKAAKMLVAMGVCMLLLSASAAIMSQISWTALAKAVVGLGSLAAIVAGLVYATKFAGNGSKLASVALVLTSMSIAIGVLAGLSIILGLVDLASLAKGVIAVSILSAMMALLVHSTKGATDASKNIVKMTVALGLLILSVVVLAGLDTANMLSAVGSLVALMAGLAIVFKSANSVRYINHKTLWSMLAAIGVLAGIISAMSLLPNPQNLIPVAASLSGLMVAFSTCMVILGKTGRISTTVAKNMLPMLGVITGLAAILSAMSFLPNPRNLMPIAEALSVLMLAFSASMVILGTVGRISTTVTKSLTPMLVVVAGLATILGLLSLVPDPNALLPTALALSTLMIAFSASLILLAVAGGISTVVTSTIGPLLAAIGIMAALAVGIGALMSLIPGDMVDKWKEGLNRFGELLSTLAYVFGDIIGSFVGGLAAGVMSGLPAIGQSLSDFATNSSTFIDVMKTVDDSVIKGVGTLAAAIAAFTIADCVNGLSSLLGVSSGLGNLGSQLSDFMINASDFIEGSKNISADSAEGVKHLVGAILDLTAADVLNGLAGWLTGGSSISDFAEDLKKLGPAIQQFASDTESIDSASVKDAAQAASILMDMAANAPKEGGMLGKIFGDSDLAKFGEDLKKFGETLIEYSAIVSTGINTEAIGVSVDAGKALGKMAEAIPNSGGLFSGLFGDNDLVTFGSKLVEFGLALNRYSTTVSMGINPEAIKNSVQAGKDLAGLAEAIPDSGGLFAGLFGDNDIGEFGRKLVAFGACLTKYSSSVVDLDTTAITTSIVAAGQLSNLANILPADGGFWSIFKNDAMSMGEFGTQIVAFGTAIKNFSNSVAGTDSGAIHSAISAGNRLVGFINGLVDLNIDGVSNFKSAMAQLGETSLDGFINAFSNATDRLLSIGSSMVISISEGIKSQQVALYTAADTITLGIITALTNGKIQFETVGGELISGLSIGMTNKKSDVESAAGDVLSAAEDAIDDGYWDFHSAGSYCVDGFVDGIDWNEYKATTAGWNLGKAALNAAYAALGVASPSKEFYKVAEFCVAGFVNAFHDGLKSSEKSGSDIANSALSGLSNAMSQIKDAVDSEIDASPTIRPVLDLTNIQNGANSISGMFAQQTVALAGINADYASINTPVGLADLMSQLKVDNESSNKEVVNAISNLRGDFGSLVSAISGLHIRMDSGTMVGELIGKIDNSLGQIASYKGRGI